MTIIKASITAGVELTDVAIFIEGDCKHWPLFVFAHGAGAPMDSPFMNQMTELLLEQGIAVARFEFPYMVQRREIGKKRPPDAQAKLLDTWRSVINRLREYRSNGRPGFIIGGKSMGGRMASMVADEMSVSGLVCIGYPFHPQGKPEKTRTEHLQDITTPTLMTQGDRDALGNKEDVAGYDLAGSITMVWLTDGDHDLKPRVRSGFTHEQNIRTAADAIADFCGRGNS